MIRLTPITTKNFWQIIELNPTKEQENFVLSNAISIAQSKIQPECIPLAICNDDIPIGFLMYCLDKDDNEYWIYRFMIDANFQGKGYGKIAMAELLKMIQQNTNKNKIYLDVDSNNNAAINLYKCLGFEFTGEVVGKAHIMLLNY